MPAKKDIAEECAVCTEMSSGYHFGVIVCRACAAFFRRTIALDMKYKCRYEGNCPIDKTVRCMCRSCRLERCLAVGMKREAIQLNRDTLKRDRDVSPRSHSLGRPPQPRAPASFLPQQEPEPEEDQIFQRINAIFEYAAKYYKSSDSETLLGRMITGYERIRQKRPLVHSEFRFIKRDPNVSAEENQRRVAHNGRVYVQICKQEMDLLADMVTTFEPFITLPAKQRWIMFKHFWIHFMMFERAFDTIMNCGHVDLETGVYANGQKMQLCKGASEIFSIASLDDEALDNLFAATNYLLFHGIYRPMVDLKPSMEEFIAAAGYMLWMHPGSSMIDTETITTAKKVRDEIFRDLHAYYISRGEEDNYAPRLAELMSIVTTVMKAVVQKKEDMLVVQLFDTPKRANTSADPSAITQAPRQPRSTRLLLSDASNVSGSFFMFKRMPKKDISEECAVCKEMSTGYHFGVIVCRACGSFFRRSIALNLKYVCNYNGHCVINTKVVRCMCRSCRLDKCFAVGMKKEAVKHYQYTVNRDEEASSSYQTRLPPSKPQITSALLPQRTSEDEDERLFQQTKAIFEYTAQHSKPSDSGTLLDRMVIGYERILQKRPIVHSESRFILRDPKVSDAENKRRGEYNSHVFGEISMHEMTLFAEMVTTFEPFLTLPPKQRWIMFKHFWLHFVLLERAFDNVINCGHYDLEIGCYANGQEMKLRNFISSLFQVPALDDEGLEKVFARSNNLLFSGVYREMANSKPSRLEFMALAGYMLWMHPGSSLFDPDIITIANGVREKIFNDLRAYYASRGEEQSFAPRLAQLLSIVTTVMKVVVQKKEDMLVLQLFDGRDIDRAKYEMFR